MSAKVVVEQFETCTVIRLEVLTKPTENLRHISRVSLPRFEPDTFQMQSTASAKMWDHTSIKFKTTRTRNTSLVPKCCISKEYVLYF